MNFMIIFPYMNQATNIAKITRVANDLMMFPSVVVVVTTSPPPFPVLVLEVKQAVHFELVSSHENVFLVYD